MSSAGISLTSFDPSLLLSYYNAKLPVAAGQQAATPAQTANSATANDAAPWENLNPPSQQVEDAQVLSLTNFIDTSNVPKTSGTTAGEKTEQDNQNLFSLYQAVNNLAYLASMSQRSGMTAGQLAGFDTRFQAGMQQVQNFIATQSFNNFTLQATAPSASVTSQVAIPFPPMNYAGGTVATDAQLADPLANVSASDSFDISVKKNGVTTDVPIDLSQVQGGLTLDNIVSYVNQQLSSAGFSTRFQRVMTSGTIDDPTNATYGISITQAPSEAITLSSNAAQPALYFAGNNGSATGTSGIAGANGSTIGATAPDQQGRLVKLTDLDSSARGVFNVSTNPDNGTTTAQSTVVDANGNVYVLGNATGDFGNQLNQGTQDAVLSKYDSAGNLQWSQLLGSAGTANGASLAVDPDGGVVVVGSTTANLTSAGIGDGNTDSFAVKYDADGNQVWTKQIPTLSDNQAVSVSVDSQSNVYIGGQVTGTIGAGQTNQGNGDGYIAKLNSKGALVYEQQSGTSGADSVSATATTPDGGLVVASVQNGHAILSKYANGDATQAPVWQVDLGDLQNGGSIGGLTVSNGNIYVSGTTSNTALNAGGAASIANASSGGTDAFVMALTDSGTSVSADHVSYIGTSSTDQGGGVTVGSDGTVYLTGTTKGTFAGQTRSATGTSNAFVAALAADGSVTWTHQYGGADGQSTGAAIAIDPTGSSVLDELGLPRGTLDVNQSVDLESNTTLRAGDSFQIQIAGASTRTATITIDDGETMDSLALKISSALGFAGSASATYANGGKALKISVNPGITATLIAGPGDSDALARLGISPGTISNAASSGSSSSSSSSSSQVFGLGFSGQPLDISTATDAGAARAQLLNVLSSIRNAYRTTNTPATPASTNPGQTGGTVPAYLTSQLASYQTALSALTALSGTSSSSSTSGTF